MKIVTYNLRFGGSGKEHWSKIIKAFDPDLFLVQESYPPDDHLPPLLFPGLSSGAVWQAVGSLKWGSGIWVKEAKIRPIEVFGFAGNVIGAEITGFPWTSGGKLLVFSVHAPHRSSYQKAVNEILDEIAMLCQGCDVVIGGDFNLEISQRQESKSTKTSAADQAIQARLRDKFGLVNCWQTANPTKDLPQTLRWAGDGGAVPYHCDGIFIPKAWASRLKSCEVQSGGEWDKMSDHNPVVATFE